MAARYLILLILSSLLVITGCTPQPSVAPPLPWEYADLRYLSPSGDAPPDLDLIAAYTRIAGNDFQIRFDLINLEDDTTFDLYIALDTEPGGTHTLPIQATSSINWDQLLILPSKGFPQKIIYDYTQPGRIQQLSSQLFRSPPSINAVIFSRGYVPSIPRIARLPWLDTIIVTLNRATVPAIKYGFKIQTFITPSGSPFPADKLGPFRSDSLPPGRAPLMLTFWNTFPAYTPAQAIRRWDGAHTGPFGERHGLNVLLQAVRHSKVPVALLDLKTPANLSALDYLEVIPKIQDLVEMGLLILPDALPGSPSLPAFPDGLPGWIPIRAAIDSRQAAQEFGLPLSDALYAPNLPAEPLLRYSIIFTELDASQPVQWQGKILIPTPAPGKDVSATSEGLALEIRKSLLINALLVSENSDHVSLTILGGSLSDSTFGDPQSAEATLRYIATHPWMQPLSNIDLHTLSRGTSAQIHPIIRNKLISTTINSLISSQLNSSIPGFGNLNRDPLYLAAWQQALSLYAPLPPESDQLLDLRGRYSGQVGFPLAASTWAAKPYVRNDCLTDLDLDGQPECVLASDKFFAIFDNYGGRLLVLYTHASDGIHQLIAPSSQFIVGLADPSTWDLSAIEGADPGGFQGAFTDSLSPWDPYQAKIFSQSLTYTSPDLQIVKTFTLTSNGLKVNYQISEALTIQIPLAIDPWERFTPGWGYRYETMDTPRGWSWYLDGGPQIEILTSGLLKAFPFNESRPFLYSVEDPNFPYPRGHYLPFPIALVEIQSPGDFYVELVVR